jgi:hypothetical protein
MIKNLVVVVSGGALAFGLAGAASPAMAWASVAHPASVTQANLPMPGGTPIIRDANAHLGHRGQVTIWNPGDPPVIRRLKAGPPVGKLSAPPDTPTVRGGSARLGCGHPGQLRPWNPADPPTVRDSTAQAAPPTIRDSKARTNGAQCTKLMNPSDPPIIRGSTAQFGDPDDGGQVTQAAARLGDPDDGGQVQAFAALGDPDDGGQ